MQFWKLTCVDLIDVLCKPTKTLSFAIPYWQAFNIYNMPKTHGLQKLLEPQAFITNCKIQSCSKCPQINTLIYNTS